MLSYSVKVCMTLIQSRQFRNTILRVLVELYLGLSTPDFINVCQCLIFLDDPQAVADILEKLIKGDQVTRQIRGSGCGGGRVCVCVCGGGVWAWWGQDVCVCVNCSFLLVVCIALY